MLLKLYEERKVSGENQLLSWKYAQKLHDYIFPFLHQLDIHLDKRLVRTFFDLLGCLIRFRDRHNGMVLSELGSYLLGPLRCCAGTKRISNLLRSKNWTHKLIDQYLFDRAGKRVQVLLCSGISPLLLWDGSVLEKAESWNVEGLGPVRSAKAKRLKRIKPGYYAPPSGTIHVPGFEWLGVVLSGLGEECSIVAMRWWSRRGKAKAHFSTIRDNMLWLLAKLPKGCIHVFDRGFAGRPFLEKLFTYQQDFILRWPKRFLLLDLKGESRNTWKFSTGRKPMDHTWIVDGQGNRRQIGMLYTQVAHPQWPDTPLYLVISRPGKKRKPWYLLTSIPITSHQKAWEVIFSYARRWKIEQTFRFAKAEMGMESPRLWFWENRLKFMAILTLAIDFIFLLTHQGRTTDIEQLLNTWNHRTGNRCKKPPAPIYRIRLALSHAWNYWIIQSSG